MKASAIVCSYNGADRIAEALTHLMQQDMGEHELEIIVVDNGSTDGTLEVAREALHTTPFPSQLLHEPTPGKSAALERGLTATSGDVFIIVDDDNLLDHSYVSEILGFLSSHKQVGACNGISRCSRPSTSADSFQPFLEMVAVDHYEGDEHSSFKIPMHLWGAGMAVRRKVYEQLLRLPFEPLLTTHRRSRLTGEDTELSFAIRLLGYDLSRVGSARLKHAISHDRFTLPSLCSLAFASGRSEPITTRYAAQLEGREASPLRDKVHLRLSRSFLSLVRHRRWAKSAPDSWYAQVCRMRVEGQFMTLLRDSSLVRAADKQARAIKQAAEARLR